MKKSKISASHKLYLIPIGLFLLISAIYIYSLCPSIYPGDNADTITAAATLGIPHPPGYPLFTLLGHLFSKIPVASIPWRINLLSALLSALTIVVLYLIVLKITKKIFAALFAALILAFSLQYFSQSLVADYLSLSILLTFLEILILLTWYEKPKKWHLYLLGLVAGINFSSHQTSSFILPAILYLIYKKDKKFFISWEFAKCIGLFIVGLLPFIYLPIRAAQNPAYSWGEPGTLSGFIAMITRQEYGHDFSQIGYFYYRFWDLILSLGWKQYYLVGFGIGIYGLVKLFKEKRPLAYFFLIALIFTGFIFAFFSNVPSDKDLIVYLERFFVISGSIFAIVIGIGATGIEKMTKLPGYFLLVIPIIFLYFNYPKANKRNYYYAIDYAKNIVKNLPDNSFVFAVGDTPTFEIWYLQYVENIRKDLTVVPGGDPAYYILISSMEKKIRDYSISIDEIAKKRPVYTTTLTPMDWQRKIDNFIPEGLIYRYSPDKDWIKGYDENKTKGFLESYTTTGVYNTKKVEDFKTQAIIMAYANAWIEHGAALHKQNNYKEAATSYLKAMEFDPENEFAWVNYAAALSSSGMYDQAIDEYRKILKKYPNSTKAKNGYENTLNQKTRSEIKA